MFKYTDINDYLEWLKEEWYDTNTVYKKRGLERIQHLEYVTLRIPSKDIEIRVPLYDWMMGTWKNGNKIKYKEVYDKIAPLMNEDEAAWLKEVTREV